MNEPRDIPQFSITQALIDDFVPAVMRRVEVIAREANEELAFMAECARHNIGAIADNRPYLHFARFNFGAAVGKRCVIVSRNPHYVQPHCDAEDETEE